MDGKENTLEVGTEVTTDAKQHGIDLSKFGQSVSNPADGAGGEDTVESLKAQLEQEKLERAKVEATAKKFKESFDKKSREKAEAEKRAREVEQKASEPIEEVARLQRELEDIKRDNMKTSLTFTLSKEWGVSDELTSKMVTSLFSEETGGFVEGDFRTAQMELIQSVREQARKEGYEEREKELLNGKPHSVGNSGAANDPLEKILSKYK